MEDLEIEPLVIQPIVLLPYQILLPRSEGNVIQ